MYTTISSCLFSRADTVGLNPRYLNVESCIFSNTSSRSTISFAIVGSINGHWFDCVNELSRIGRKTCFLFASET